MKMKLLSISVFLFVLTSVSAQNRIYRHPDVSKDKVVFSFADDLWLVDKEGGQAVKLSSPAGAELFPRFAPDGKTVAFSGNYDGNVDIYSIPTAGGIPKRLTHHGMADRLVDWTPDGKELLFASSMQSGKQRYNQFYTVKAMGSLPQKLPMEHAEFGSYSPDGNKIAYTYKSRVFRTWKRYEGGMSADIFIFDLETLKSENITENNYNDEIPMWHNNSIYYISDKGKESRYNIWKYDINSSKHSQVTKFNDVDVHLPANGPEDIVFEAGGKLFLLNLGTEKYSEIKISLTNDYEKVKPHWVNVKSNIQNAFVSPRGERVLIEARGDIFDLPAEKGAVVNLTNSSGAAERYPAWSPDGKNLAYWSDTSGEYQLYIHDYKSGKVKKVTDFTNGFNYQIYWSPDGDKLAFINQAMEIRLIDIQSGEITKVDKGKWMYEGALRGFSVSWSPDSRWITYDRGLDNRQNAIFLFDTEEKELHQVTSGFYNYNDPVFSSDGKYICFETDQRFDPEYSNFDNSWVYVNSNQLAMIPLSLETPSPLLAEHDTVTIEKEKTESKDGKEEEKKDEDSNKESDAEGDNAKEDDDEKNKTRIDLENIESRTIILPIQPGSIGSISAIEGKVLYMRYPTSAGGVSKPTLQYFDLKEKKEETIIDGINFYMLTADGKKILTGSPQKMGIISVGKGQKLEKTIALDEMQIKLDPRQEWKQIFSDVWRIERDFFYDENMHGVDWNQQKEHYGELLANANSRTDVNYIIGELIGELNASHTYRGGGDNEDSKSTSVGYLGVNFSFENGAFRIDEIIRPAPWDTEVRSPLDEPGLEVTEGDYILAVNGISLNDFTDPWGAFSGLADKTVELLINDSPDKTDARKIYVKTMSSETRLRNLSWIEKNRKYVEEASNGRIGYVYVPSTGLDGQKELVRMFYGQIDKEGMIVDERFNNGGQIPDRFIELLDRPALAYWDVRDGENWAWPPTAHFGPKAMLINGWSGSGGDAFPDYFRKTGLGPLIGTTTWGGLIGITGAPSLIDGGSVTAPTFRMYNPDGTWFKEGHGVDPDIEVPEDPTELAKGHDSQLEAAVQNVLEQLKSAPKRLPAPPPVEKRN
ncbi:S41 family peptidase [Membranihabitans maritimus]|uniref:S41 family peptidase n=1 Tax=Membranihabitans maritimus TaxID=2904244 RepID=UPI001F240389|nr:S41 family peptidase [Membranihabitans maritimus]